MFLIKKTQNLELISVPENRFFMSILEALIILSSIEGLGVRTLHKLISAFKFPQEILQCKTVDQLRCKVNISIDLADQILLASRNINPVNVIEECQQEGVSIISIFDSLYPEKLSEIYDPPLLLFIKGNLLPQDNTAFSIVGSRRASVYGKQMALRFASELASSKITVVSGLARGIDAAAHEGALRGGGRTLAVLGTGVDIVYPRENRKIYEAVIESGALISEYPIGTEIMPFRFPQRNRIIAGLSLGILVVEAGHKSGSLITARMGADEGREIYVIPGQIDSPFSHGTNHLIQEGARLVTSTHQIIEDLLPMMNVSGISPLAHGCDTPQLIKESVLQVRSTLTAEENCVLNCISKEPENVENIRKTADFDLNKTLALLTRLEMGGHISRVWGGGFRKCDVYLSCKSK